MFDANRMNEGTIGIRRRPQTARRQSRGEEMAAGVGPAAFTPVVGCDETILLAFPKLLAKQTTKGCCLEVCCMAAPVEFQVSTFDNPDENIFYALEDSSFCYRLCCPTIHPFDMTLAFGQEAGGPPIMKMHQNLKCPAGPCKCCCYQQMDVFSGASGEPIGMIRERYSVFLPQYDIVKPDGTVEYRLHQPTCCNGYCVDCCAESFCNFRVPILLFDPNSGGSGIAGEEYGKIVKSSPGIFQTLLTDADRFEVEFPTGSDMNSRSRIMAAMFFMNQLHFENKPLCPRQPA